jgi:PAS domain S-box-containing protein
MVGGDLRIRRFTPPAKKALNLLPTDVGRPIGDIKPAVIVPDLEAVIGEVIEKVQPVEREVRDRDGRWFVLRIHPYRTADHKIDGAVLVMVDIDLVHSVQEELQRQATLLELSQDAIVIRDTDNRIIFWNRGAGEIYGWTAEEAKGKALHALLQTDPAAWAELNARLDQAGTWEGELRQIRRDGSPIIVHCREVLVRDEKKVRLAVLAIKRDVTERKRVMEALKEADRRKDEFLATLAHELRNPLGPIRNAVEIMRLAGDDPAEVARALSMLDRQGRQLARIVDDLIDLTRIAEKKIELRKERVTLGAVVETALETCRSLIEGCRHRLTVTLPPEPLYIDADPVRLSQVLVNLLNNAAKFTEAGGQIWLTAERAASDPLGGGAAGVVVLRVRDTGIGIPADLVPHIFEMFTQGDRAPEQGRGGLGVGLTLVRSLVQMHGGRVDVRSDGPGRGSEFVVRLPLAGGPPEAGTGAGPTPGTATLAPKRILVVDDNHDQAESLGTLLRLLGHEVRVAENGPDGLQAAADFGPDVALVDIGLPGMNGYEVARRIREQPQLHGLVLVAQTGWGQDDDRRRSGEAGFDHHLVKPVDLGAIQELLRSLPTRK